MKSLPTTYPSRQYNSSGFYIPNLTSYCIQEGGLRPTYARYLNTYGRLWVTTFVLDPRASKELLGARGNMSFLPESRSSWCIIDRCGNSCDSIIRHLTKTNLYPFCQSVFNPLKLEGLQVHPLHQLHRGPDPKYWHQPLASPFSPIRRPSSIHPDASHGFLFLVGYPVFPFHWIEHTSPA